MRHLRWENIVSDRAFFARRVPDGEQTAPHDHDFWEAFCVLKGTARHIVNGRLTQLSRGDVWLVRPEDVHAIEAEPDFSNINVAWPAPVWTKWLGLAQLSSGDAATVQNAPELEPAFARMNAAFSSGSAREALHLTRFWAELAPRFWPSTDELDPRPDWMRRVLERFEREDGIRGGYQFLLKIAPVSPRGLHREWMRAFGVAPSDWIGQKRLERAAITLLQTSLSVQEVAAQSGFQNVPYFFRAWKRKYDVSPARFREAARRNLD